MRSLLSTVARANSTVRGKGRSPAIALDPTRVAPGVYAARVDNTGDVGPRYFSHSVAGSEAAPHRTPASPVAAEDGQPDYRRSNMAPVSKILYLTCNSW